MRVLSKGLSAFILLGILAACSGGTPPSEDKPLYPQNPEDRRKARFGKLTGEGGITLWGADGKENGTGGASPIGVNSFLWRATLDTLSFMPIASADPFGGVILTDWYEDPKTRGERFKITAMILDRQLRTDAIKVSVFKQAQDETGTWRDYSVSGDLGRKLEDTILTQAREMRVRQGD